MTDCGNDYWFKIKEWNKQNLFLGKTLMKTIKIFLASSGELLEERKEISSFIRQENDRLINDGIYFKLIIWEDLLHSFSGDRVQNYFNEEMLTCDIVIALFYKKVGQFTKEEFDKAHKNLINDKNPRYLFVFFKDVNIPISDINEDVMKIVKLKEKIEKAEQMYDNYNSTQDLILKLKKQLDHLSEQQIIYNVKKSSNIIKSQENITISFLLENSTSIRTTIQVRNGLTCSGLMPFNNDEFVKVMTEFPKMAFRYPQEQYIKNYITNYGKKIYNLTLSHPVIKVLENLSSTVIELIIEPSLRYIAWELMHDGDEFLCIKHNFGRCLNQNTDNVTLHQNDIIKKYKPHKSNIYESLNVLIVSTTYGYNEELDNLSNFFAEYSNVKLQTLSDDNATKHKILDYIYQGYDIIHIIGHSTENGLDLNDGFLEFNIIAEAAVSKKPALLVLSVCETSALIDSGYLLSLKGLNVVSPLTWINNDSIYYHYHFYNALLKGKSFGESIRYAKSKIYFSDSYSWWSYIFYGNPSECIEKPLKQQEKKV